MRLRARARIAALLTAVPMLGAAADELSAPKRDGLDVAVGRALFQRDWVPAPASTSKTDGLGPLFNARSCAECHRGAGRGELKTDGEGWLKGAGFIVRLGDEQGAPDPVYGRQIQTRAVQGLAAEARVRVNWQKHAEKFADGSELVLKRPVIELADLGYGPLAPDTQVSLRLAPDLRVAARIAAAELRPGTPRFGRKATGTTLAGQVADAFALDLGLSSSMVPAVAGDCTDRQRDCLAQPHGAAASEAELPDAVISSLVTYLASLESKDDDTSAFKWPVMSGADAFAEAGCGSCHTPRVPGQAGRPVVLYSDLKLHDLGDDLADPAGTMGRMSSQWRTQPLVGVGAALAEGRPLLHDGRADTVAEAIMWHGGEAADARERYRRMDGEQRRALDDFVATR